MSSEDGRRLRPSLQVQQAAPLRAEGHPKMPGQSLGALRLLVGVPSRQGRGRASGAAHTRPASMQVSNVLFIRYFDDYK